ncbi:MULTISPECIES: peptidoglycan-binding protein [Actinoplanes]|uniref:peptidoglycan-binding domain-containing protein n=1 Tax=Actinoplanes TaxID=1865 RepID=UPI0005F2B4D5|nr:MULTISPECIES: peptidoglycan-binding protein [Actinoplanes]GLY04211.1 hypothetical protein Acsp01_45900 [Actinoplanes sp. NBRC 101535]
MTDTLNPWPTTRQGTKDHPVPTLQYLLLAHGHTVTVDGVFGPQTGEAVRAYQRTRGLTDDGVVGPDTWHALLVEVAPGSRGNAVRGVQHRAGVTVEPDGEYGPRTQDAVREVQAAVLASGTPIAVDGVIGPKTWQALIGGVSAPLSRAA